MDLKNLTYKRKNQLLIAGMLLVLLVSWNFAFKNTAEAINLNRNFHNKSSDSQSLTYNASYLTEKSFLLDNIVCRYQADSLSWKNSFWTHVSKSIPSHGVSVIYQPDEKSKQQDVPSVVTRQHITFDADYKKLLMLLDSLQKRNEAGYVSSVSLNTNEKRRSETIENVRMKMVFSILKK